MPLSTKGYIHKKRILSVAIFNPCFPSNTFSQIEIWPPHKQKKIPGFVCNSEFPKAHSKTYPETCVLITLELCHSVLRFLGPFKVLIFTDAHIGRNGVTWCLLQSGILEMCGKGSRSEGANVQCPEQLRIEDKITQINTSEQNP